MILIALFFDIPLSQHLHLYYGFFGYFVHYVNFVRSDIPFMLRAIFLKLVE